MQIRNFLRESFIDYPNKISSVIFVPGCDYNCPACHAKHLLENGENINENDFFEYIDSRKGWIEGIVICGGEATLEATLIPFVEKIKKRDLAIKLDTNGSKPDILKQLLEKKLVDYVAMDVKAPEYLYKQITNSDIDISDIKDSMRLVSEFSDYEFRTTIVPVKRNKEISFMTLLEIADTAKMIYRCTGSREHKYFLQPFVPRKGELIDSTLEACPETPHELLEKCLISAQIYLPNAKIRT